jgi:hypothetical protein
MTIETAAAWMRIPENHREFERLVRLGYLPAKQANDAWWAAKHARGEPDAKGVVTPGADYPRLRDYWLDKFNDFLRLELMKDGRAELRSRFDYKVSDFGVKQK